MPKLTAALIKRLINIWPPFLGAGIHVNEISKDFRSARVTLKLKLLNRNIVGVHFGGSLFAMTDPFFMLMVSQNLGREYIVWDRAARIEFLKPGKGKVTAQFAITQEQINEIIQQAASGEKIYQDFLVNITDKENDVVAQVTKTLYIRKKQA
jgi:acyl-coenzyme A thioesterase PaaI-like protein